MSSADQAQGLPSYVYSSDRQGPFAANDLSAASHMGQYPIAPSHHAFNPLYEDAHNSTPRSIPAAPQTPRGMESLSGAQPVTASLDQRPGSNNNDPATATSVTIRPPAGYPGIMLEIRLEGGHLVQFLTELSTRGDLECLICFDTAAQSAAVHIIPKSGPPTQIVFLCLVPDIQLLGLCPVTLHVFADQTQHSVPLGAFHYRQNDGTQRTYHFPDSPSMMSYLQQQIPVEDPESAPPLRIPHSVPQVPDRFDPQPYHPQNYTTQMPVYLPPSDYFSNAPGTLAQPLGNLHYHPQTQPSALTTYPPHSLPRPNLPNLARHPHSDPQQYTLGQLGNESSTRPRNNAKLIFRTKPDTLGDYSSWTFLEQQDSRRIVRFSKITIPDGYNSFELDSFPVPANEWASDMITISCIRWEPNHKLPDKERHPWENQCVFTSVDIIKLLELIVEVDFDVSEKNRIRRNLECLHPETVKKEGNTQSFFNQAMTYSQPKVRNIEKDIKVFLWKDISRACKKIIGKYARDGTIKFGNPHMRPASEPRLSEMPTAQMPTNGNVDNSPVAISNSTGSVESPVDANELGRSLMGGYHFHSSDGLNANGWAPTPSFPHLPNGESPLRYADPAMLSREGTVSSNSISPPAHPSSLGSGQDGLENGHVNGRDFLTDDEYGNDVSG